MYAELSSPQSLEQAECPPNCSRVGRRAMAAARLFCCQSRAASSCSYCLLKIWIFFNPRQPIFNIFHEFPRRPWAPAFYLGTFICCEVSVSLRASRGWRSARIHAFSRLREPLGRCLCLWQSCYQRAFLYRRLSNWDEGSLYTQLWITPRTRACRCGSRDTLGCPRAGRNDLANHAFLLRVMDQVYIERRALIPLEWLSSPLLLRSRRWGCNQPLCSAHWPYQLMKKEGCTFDRLI